MTKLGISVDNLVVELSQRIECPLEKVRAHFRDMRHHERHRVHAAASFKVISDDGTTCRYEQRTRILGVPLIDRCEMSFVDGGRLINRNVSGPGSGMITTFAFADVQGQATRVDVSIQVPLVGLKRILRPFLSNAIERGFRAALEEDRIDLEVRGYPR